MDEDDVRERVSEVTSSHSKKKPTEKFGNINVHTSWTADVLEGDDPAEVNAILDELVKAENERSVAERYEAFLRAEEDDE